jgi:outer membrane lipoprotein carrier protein
LGQRTSIVFSEQQLNPELNEQTFYFRVPADADLLVDIEG